MQQKVIVIGAQSTALKAAEYLTQYQLQTNIEIISHDEALKRGINARYHTEKERAVSAIEVIKQYDHKIRPSRAFRRAQARKNKK